ncbi:MAG: hypothetical protein ACSHXI_18720 [Hoeflea sp.]|uniref:hypothetical protein n=1 Tax=Hoeflea sp. TaxID=1940281 RepID=UPI003EF8B1CE
MQAALIIMTILGCDDSATQCHYVEMRDERWATVQSCDAASEDRLKGYSNLNYPVVVAVCQTPGDTGLAEVADEPEQDTVQAPAPEADTSLTSVTPIPKADIPEAQTATLDATEPAVAITPDAEPGMTTRVLNLVKEALPEKARVKALLSEPVHVVTDSYSWVIQRFEK